ncbi:MAG: aldose 1-epimerase [Candidatus Hermodarchaeota archaeon]
MPQNVNYIAQEVLIDSIEVIQLFDRRHHVQISIVPSIGNIAYEMKVHNKNILWMPFSNLQEFKTNPHLCGNPFLAPWANRLDQDAFYANKKKYLLNPKLGNFQRDANQKPIHGLLQFSPDWKVISLTADDQAASVTSRLEFWRFPELMAQFPFAHTIEITYRLQEGVLEVETLLENHSTQNMPVAIGYHPYFQLPDTPRDEWKVHLAAHDHLVLSEKLIPTGERRPVSLPDPLPLAGRELDDVFSNLIREKKDRTEFFVQGKKERISVIYGANYTVAVVYAPINRDFICFEPMSAITNGFNLAHNGIYKELQTISPQETWRESFWIQPSGF